MQWIPDLKAVIHPSVGQSIRLALIAAALEFAKKHDMDPVKRLRNRFSVH